MSLWGNAVGAAMGHVLYLSGGTMIGGINMNQNSLAGLKTPTQDDQAVPKKYADDLVKNKVERTAPYVALPASGWTGDQAPYSQTVAVEGITADDCPRYGVVYSASYETALREREAFGRIDDLDTAAGSVTFTCFDSKPKVDLTVQMEVIR